MMQIEKVRELALSFLEATEEPHFEKTSFRIRKKIFATLDIKKHKITLKLSEIDQSVFCAFDESTIYPVPGSWGKQGWTIMELSKIKKEILMDALTKSYCKVAPKKLATQYIQPDGNT